MQSVKDKEYHKTTSHNKPHIRDCWEGKPRRWLPLLGQKATENWAENQFLAELGRINAFQGGLGLDGLCGLNLGQAQGYMGYSSVGSLSPQGRGMKQTLWPSENFGGGTWPLEVLRWYTDDEHLEGSDLATPWSMCDVWRSLEARLIRGSLYTA